MTNRELHRQLLQKLGITKQGLSQRVKQLKKAHPMTTEEGTYVIAHQAGLLLDRYLDADTIARIRTLTLQISAAPPRIEAQGTSRPTTQHVSRTFFISKEFKESDPILPVSILQDAQRMAGIYPLLYVLENSVRELISRVMTLKFGSDWWDSQASQKLRGDAARRMKDEERNAWHQRRGAHAIHYLDLKELPSIVRKDPANFVPDILPSVEWLDSLISEVYESRCVLCHMNPLSDDNIQRVKLRFRDWQRQIREKMNLISTPDTPSLPR